MLAKWKHTIRPWMLLMAMLVVLAGIPLQQVAAGGASSGAIAYVYRGDGAAASSFSGLLTSAGYSVDLVPLGSVMATDFSSYNLILVADDTGNLDEWGLPAPPATADQVAKLTTPNSPILGLGEGGYALFGKLSLAIGWPNGWHGPLDSVNRAAGAPPTYFSSPNPIGPDPIKLYTQPVNEVGIFLDPTAVAPTGLLPIGIETRDKQHAPLIMQNCRQLWGFSGDPSQMTDAGKKLFVNAVQYARFFQCSQPPAPPTQDCINLVKSANPPAGTHVEPGDVIAYTLTYRFSNDPACNNTGAKLVDVIPNDTIYVPNSASGGINPAGDGALSWLILPAAGDRTHTFKVIVADTQCGHQESVVNWATLRPSDGRIIESNHVNHPVNCPPISMPNEEPPYAEQEVSIHPYPMVTGHASTIKVRLTNSSAVPQPVRVSYQASPERFGIGILFNTFDTDLVVIPVGGSVIVESSFTPVSSGHYCIQIKIEDASPTPQYAPIYTSRNLDVTEDLRPGQADDLVFRVANPTSATADIRLAVDNTCPGWLAEVIPTNLSAVGPNSADVRNATLRVTPPNPVTLGTGCHIDVQGWIGDQLIGGIRKLDVPPVHLPRDVSPPWLEPEISLIPNPPIVGQPAQICVELQNPLAVPKTVTVRYAVADFGAGIPFTEVGTRTIVLPPNSIDRYCINWTPTDSNNLHRCIQITLQQPGYQDMHSQRNIDLRRVVVGNLATLQIPVTIRNPDLVSHRLQIDPVIYGLDPYWEIRFIGDPPPNTIAPGQTLGILIGLRPVGPTILGIGRMQAAAPLNYRYGDETRIDVGVKMDGEQIGGFTFALETSQVTLPLVVR